MNVDTGRRFACSIQTLGLLLSLAGCTEPPAEAAAAPPRVRCVPAETRSLSDQVVLRGVVVPSPDRSATLSAQVPGRLVRVAVREGDEVQQGDLIAEVEAEPARDTLQEARAALAQAVAERDAARLQASHEESLVAQGIAARQTLEATRARLARAEAAVAATSAQVHTARQGLSRTAVHAPMAGAIVHLLRREGELVDGTPATPICDVVDMSAIEVEAPAAPEDIVRLRPGQPAQVDFDALAGVELAGTVRSVGRALGANGMGKVWLSLRLGELQPPLGLLATCHIAISDAHEVVTVPSVAIRTAAEDGSEVVVCDEGKTRIRSVQVGRRGDGWVVVSGGLSTGERVAVDEVTGLEDGDAIREAPESP